MMKSYKSWISPSLGTKMEIYIFGREGTPVILFPSEYGTCSEWEENGAFEILKEQIEKGYNQFFCVSSFASEKLLSHSAEPLVRIKKFNQYQEYIADELLPFVAWENSNPFIITSGVGTGAHCALLAMLKNPLQFQRVIGISGYYDISDYMNCKVGDNTYFNKTTELTDRLIEKKILNDINTVDIRLLNFKNDPAKDATRRMSDSLWLKSIEHEHYIWDEEATGVWTLAPYMLKDNLF